MPHGASVIRKIEFSASHFFWVAAWSAEENRHAFGPTANRFGHGHNYTLRVCVGGELDPHTGMVVNLKHLKRWMQQAIFKPLNFKHLNLQVPYFWDNQPTLESLAVYCWQRLVPYLKELGHTLIWLEIAESHDLCVRYRGGQCHEFNLARVHADSLEDTHEASPLLIQHPEYQGVLPATTIVKEPHLC